MRDWSDPWLEAKQALADIQTQAAMGKDTTEHTMTLLHAAVELSKALRQPKPVRLVNGGWDGPEAA